MLFLSRTLCHQGPSGKAPSRIQVDILLNICDAACIGGMLVWQPTPQGDLLREVRRHLYIEHAHYSCTLSG